MLRAALLLALALAGTASAETAPSALAWSEASLARMQKALEEGKGYLNRARESSEPAPKREAYLRAEASFLEARAHLELCRKAWPEDEALAETASQIAQLLYECRKCRPMEIKPG